MGDGSKERRDSPRRRALKGATIVYQDRRFTLPCTVRDVSAAGARLRVEGSVAVPDKFVLIIGLDDFEADCQVVSRKGKELGVRFTSPPRSARSTQAVKGSKAGLKDRGW